MLSFCMPRTRNISQQTRILLAALSSGAQVWRHGYELSKLTGLKSGTLYPLLIRLSEQGLLDSKWMAVEQPGRPPRHVYRLTPSGLALARTQAAQDRSARANSKPLPRPT
jgi:DNA-binding PadR family transcriptional regulator